MKTKPFIILLMLGFISIAAHAEAGSSAWITQPVEEGQSINWDAYRGARAIATDSAGNACIVYGGSRLFFARNNGTEWQPEIVDPDSGSGSYSCVAVGPNDHVHIAYLSGGQDPVLKYATNASGTWVNVVLDNEGTFPSIAVDESGHVHMSFRGSERNVIYATNASGSWVLETIPDSSIPAYNHAKGTSIALDSLGYVHISYNVPDALISSAVHPAYATNRSGSWTSEVIDSDKNYLDDYYLTGLGPSIAVDSSDIVHVSYGKTDDKWYGGYELIHASNGGGTWQAETVHGPIYYAFGVTVTSIGIDSLDTIHIVFRLRDFVNYVNKPANGSWSSPYSVDQNTTGCEGCAASLALDSSNRVHLSYQDRSEDFRHSWLEYGVHSGEWSIEVAVSDKKFSQTDMATDTSGNVHMVYCANDYLKHATNTSGRWISEVVDPEVPSWSKDYYDRKVAAIAIDPAGQVHVGYVGSGILKHAHNTGGSWTVETVDDSGRCGSVAISVDTLGYVHLSYNDLTSGVVKYASNSSGVWATEAIGSFGYEASETAIAVDASGYVHVVYCSDTYELIYEQPSGNLYRHYVDVNRAHNSNGAWEVQLIDAPAFYSENPRVNAYISCGMDSADTLHVAYSYDRRLRYARNYGSGELKKRTLYEEGLTGGSLAVDAFGRVHISEGRAYATDLSGAWEMRTIYASGEYELISWACIAADASSQVYVGYNNKAAQRLLIKHLAVDFGASVIRGDKPLTVAFTDLSPGANTNWLWDFGDGQSSTDQNPSHTYMQEGDYTVSLIVTGPDGSYTQTKQNYIHVFNHLCTCNLVPDSTTVMRGGTLGFDVSITNNSGRSGTVLLGTKVTMPDGSRTGFVWGPLDVSLYSGQTKSGHKTHSVPVGFDLGTYTYHGYVGKYGTIFDECSFQFEVTQ